jgi:hypothetical protein
VVDPVLGARLKRKVLEFCRLLCGTVGLNGFCQFACTPDRVSIADLFVDSKDPPAWAPHSSPKNKIELDPAHVVQILQLGAQPLQPTDAFTLLGPCVGSIAVFAANGPSETYGVL